MNGSRIADAPKHMTGNRKLFSTYKAYSGGNVVFGSNRRGNIIGKGTISNDSFKIDNVEHVDNLGFNLLSIGQICDNKCKVTFSEHDSEITKNGKVIVIKKCFKKVGLEDSNTNENPYGPPMILTHKSDEECESVDSTKYRGMIGTTHLGLWYPKGTGIETVVYADSDHAGDYVDRKSTSGICTFVGCCLTSWFSKKQTALAISTTEAEYVSAGKACQQALWMKQALIDYDVRLDDVPIMCDNKGAIDLSKNLVQHSRTKHIEIRHHFLRDNVQKGHISIEKVPSIDNIADILTKPLKRESFNYLRLGLGMMEHIP
ncbi:hypothetical protein Tco_1202519 [Tanacetum coccineum]